MPLICIGPVCVPISAVLPVVLWALRPLWEALPAPMRERIAAAVRPLLAWLDHTVFSKLRRLFGRPSGTGAAAGSARAEQNGASTSASTAPQAIAAFSRALALALDGSSGAVHAIGSTDELAAARELSAARSCALVLDFTAPWCGPCQRIKPHYAALAKKHPSHIFAVIDVDEAPELQAACGVLVLPTFQVCRGAQKPP